MGTGTVLWHLSEIAGTHSRQTTSKLPTQRGSRLSLPLVAMLSKLNDQSFGIPLSLPHYGTYNIAFKLWPYTLGGVISKWISLSWAQELRI